MSSGEPAWIAARIRSIDAFFEAARAAPPAITSPEAFALNVQGAGRAAAPSAVARTVAQAALNEGVDPALALAVASNESGFDPLAVSRAGAQGVMQLMPQTAASLGVRDPFDAVENARGGAAYLRDLVAAFGDVRLAVAAYNAGPQAVRRFHGVPPYAETRAYVDRVVASYHAYRSAAAR
jgi:soluble lytic murein transglycosylase-like protein